MKIFLYIYWIFIFFIMMMRSMTSLFVITILSVIAYITMHSSIQKIRDELSIIKLYIIAVIIFLLCSFLDYILSLQLCSNYALIGVNIIIIIHTLSCICWLIFLIPKNQEEFNGQIIRSAVIMLLAFVVCNIVFAKGELQTIIQIYRIHDNMENVFWAVYLMITAVSLVNFKVMYDTFCIYIKTEFFSINQDIFCIFMLATLSINIFFLYIFLGIFKEAMYPLLENYSSLIDYIFYLVGRGIQETDSLEKLNTENVFAYGIVKLNIVGGVGLLISALSGKIKDKSIS